MIFVTGDTHRERDIAKLNIDRFPEQRFLTHEDYLIVSGDFGGVWAGNSSDDEVLDYHNNKNYTTLFVSGNHENFDALEKYPVETWNGGQIRRIRDNIINLMNGNVYEIEGKKIFIMGGATSIDRMFRKEGISWWPQEEPSNEDFLEATRNLVKYSNEVDYIITHTCPEKVRKNAMKMAKGFNDYTSRVEQFLDIIYDNVTFKKWYCGHIHIDREFREYNLRVLFNGIVKI